VATSGRGTGRNRPRGNAGPARSRPQARRSGPARGTGAQTRPQPRGARPARGNRRPPGPARPRPRLTGRTAIVVVVLAVLFVSYASSLRAYLAQRSHIDELEAQIATDRYAIANLQQESRRWSDEAYVEAQARERFGWVLPGEVGFRVIGQDGQPLDAAWQLTDPASLGKDPDAQWWTTTVASIRGAGKDEDAGPPPARHVGPRPKHKHKQAGHSAHIGPQSTQPGGTRAR
jgi:cell division protein FtsB